MKGVSLVKPGAVGRYGLAILGENVNQVFAFQAEIVIVSILKVCVWVPVDDLLLENCLDLTRLLV